MKPQRYRPPNISSSLSKKSRQFKPAEPYSSHPQKQISTFYAQYSSTKTLKISYFLPKI